MTTAKVEDRKEGQPVAIGDRRKQLLEEAEKNEALNDELDAMQVEQNKKAQAAFDNAQNPPDPDEQRESAITAQKQQDPAERKKQAEAAQKSNPKYTPSPTTPDFKAGQASG
jgi:hypothetical protein